MIYLDPEKQTLLNTFKLPSPANSFSSVLFVRKHHLEMSFNFPQLIKLYLPVTSSALSTRELFFSLARTIKHEMMRTKMMQIIKSTKREKEERLIFSGSVLPSVDSGRKL